MTETILIILNLFALESMLSVDNAAVLALMVKGLPDKDKNKALRYGLIGAYVFRGACLLLASFLVKIIWLKIAGGIYLVYLAFDYFKSAGSNDELIEAKENKIFVFAQKIGINKLWSTIILVEIMDLAFSIDNVFAAVALSSNFYIIMAGVAMGILAMRFVSGWFVKIMERYKKLEPSAFVVIFLLGLKLIVSGSLSYIHGASVLHLREFIDSHVFDLFFSGLMMLIFFSGMLIKTKKTA